MTKVEEARLNMCRAVIAFLDENAAITGTIAAFADFYTAFTDKIAAQTEAAEGGSAVITGAATDKAKKKRFLAEETNRIGAVITSYATGVDNNELKEAADFSISDLIRMKDEEIAFN